MRGVGAFSEAMGRLRRIDSNVQIGGLRVTTDNSGRWTALDAARLDGCDIIMTDVADQLPYFVGAAER